MPVFGCYIGMLPTFEIAKVLQEEGAAIFYAGGKLQFRRLAELAASPAQDRREGLSDPPVPFASLSREIRDPALSRLIGGFAADARRN